MPLQMTAEKWGAELWIQQSNQGFCFVLGCSGIVAGSILGTLGMLGIKPVSVASKANLLFVLSLWSMFTAVFVSFKSPSLTLQPALLSLL